MPSRATKVDPGGPSLLTPVSKSALLPADKGVVDALDATLDKWEGPKSLLPGDPAPGGILGSGWWGEGSPEYERRVGGQASWKGRIKVVAEAIEAYKDPTGVRLAETLAQIPEAAQIPYLPSATQLPWLTILQRARSGGYSTLLDFDKDMTRLFDKARRWFRDQPAQFGAVLTLQRLYNAVTAPFPFEITGVIRPSPTRFASLPAGPGVARTGQEVNEALRNGATPEQAGYPVTNNRILTDNRLFTEEARHKGVSYRTGDFVHLINPSDASRPIVGQVFKTFVPTKGYITHHVTVCWYFHPEQVS
jgi:chromatin structure-remodeling complex subunit RSC1/2